MIKISILSVLLLASVSLFGQQVIYNEQLSPFLGNKWMYPYNKKGVIFGVNASSDLIYWNVDGKLNVDDEGFGGGATLGCLLDFLVRHHYYLETGINVSYKHYNFVFSDIAAEWGYWNWSDKDCYVNATSISIPILFNFKKDHIKLFAGAKAEYFLDGKLSGCEIIEKEFVAGQGSHRYTKEVMGDSKSESIFEDNVGFARIGSYAVAGFGWDIMKVTIKVGAEYGLNNMCTIKGREYQMNNMFFSVQYKF